MGCTHPLRRRFGALHQCPLGVGSTLPLPLYADERLHIPMTNRITQVPERSCLEIDQESRQAESLGSLISRRPKVSLAVPGERWRH